MPSVTQGTVLVSGASGYIAVHVVQELLSRGYTVRGTVRSSEKGDWLVNKFKGKGDFTYTIVEDLEKEGGFDKAVKGVDAVLHTASPFHFKAEDPYKDLVNPAVNGTLSVLHSIKKHGSHRVKRVVITSSYAAVLDTRIKPVHTFTEADWNENSPAELERLGKDVDQPNAYRASKTLAERAAWKFIEDEKPAFDLVCLNPPFVIGPIAHQVSKPESLNTSVAAWYGFLDGTKSGDDAGPAGNEVDVRNLAQAHVQAIAVEEAGGNRFAITNQAYSWQDALDIANDNKEIKDKFPKLPKGTPGAGKEVKQNLYDGSKSKKILKIDYIPLEKTIIDMSQSLSEYKEAGWQV